MREKKNRRKVARGYSLSNLLWMQMGGREVKGSAGKV